MEHTCIDRSALELCGKESTCGGLVLPVVCLAVFFSSFFPLQDLLGRREGEPESYLCMYLCKSGTRMDDKAFSGFVPPTSEEVLCMYLKSAVDMI